MTRISAALFSMLVSVLLVAAPAMSQAPVADNSKPASSTMRGAQYPRVHPDGRVTFRLKAPTARSVQVQPVLAIPQNNGVNGLGQGPYDMLRDNDGNWTVSTPPAVPGMHEYQFIVDGLAINDPATDVTVATDRWISYVEVPEPGVDFYLTKDVPHGEVRTNQYYSKVLGAWRRIFVYTPPGYDNQANARLPVLYLRHGGGQDETGWVIGGRITAIMDNLIAAGKAKPMLVVMDSNSAVKPDGSVLPPAAQAITQITINELIPFVDSHYRTVANREHRAMAGLSGGSVQTLAIGLPHLEVFSALGIFSRRPEPTFLKDYAKEFADVAALNQKLQLFWWGAGTAEVGIYYATKSLMAEFDKLGVQHVFVEIPNTAHEWQTWRKSLYDFAPRLFR